jgi:TPP-dependent trihydroxycyclohexane-1,2-dione (THcHDO) dehydratase
VALAAARRHRGPALVACQVEPRRPLLDSGAWWDLGVAHTSSDPRTRELAQAHVTGAPERRWLG